MQAQAPSRLAGHALVEALIAQGIDSCFGVPAALAAALLDSQRTVASQAGDGDFLMTGQELAIATGHGVKRLVCIVIDNGSFRTIRMHQERKFPGAVER